MTSAPHESNHALVETYLQHWATNDEALFWAYERVDDVVRKDPEHGWVLVLALVEAAPDDAALDYVAAGPLEDWICKHGHGRMERVTAACKSHRRFRDALPRVWGRNRMTAEVARTMERLIQRRN